MKYQVTASEYADLSEDVQKNYGSEKDGKHTFKIDGMPEIPDVTGLKAKNEQLLTEAKDAKTERDQAKKDLQKATKKKAKEDGDVEALETSWQTKYDTMKTGLEGERDTANSALDHATSHTKALELSTMLAVKGCASGLMPHIEPRIYTEIVDGKAVTKVKDIHGQPSALTLEELEQEIAGNEALAPLIEASKAAGGGANGNNRGGAAPTKTVNKAQWGEMNPTQRMEFSKDGGSIIDT